ncbi:hypothetical protein L596_005106 [Steinernema carpocapsae]|uniref:Uncharacterized protein n=1 Tax=Steinernema carpocapsae TaxID=34508 RepID=A0A4U8UZ01_STECR|nr:hypothetical protein L596_005106 [Steinernema carpocapsae]
MNTTRTPQRMARLMLTDLAKNQRIQKNTKIHDITALQSGPMSECLATLATFRDTWHSDVGLTTTTLIRCPVYCLVTWRRLFANGGAICTFQ